MAAHPEPTQRATDAVDHVIHAGDKRLHAILEAPSAPRGAVVLVHGTGLTRHDPGQRATARELHAHGLATLSIDLLDEGERRTPYDLFDVDVQALRLLEASRWLRARQPLGVLPVGYLGRGLGASVALCAAARERASCDAIVVDRGRPDAATFWLSRVACPVLFIVEAGDRVALHRAQDACARMPGETRLVALPHADGGDDASPPAVAAADHAARWFLQNFGDDAQPGPREARSAAPPS
jgi:putative phosphoribosyl transferase